MQYLSFAIDAPQTGAARANDPATRKAFPAERSKSCNWKVEVRPFAGEDA